MVHGQKISSSPFFHLYAVLMENTLSAVEACYSGQKAFKASDEKQLLQNQRHSIYTILEISLNDNYFRINGMVLERLRRYMNKE